MEAIAVASFLDELYREGINYWVDGCHTNFNIHFGANGDGAEEERDGTYVAFYVLDNSLDKDLLLDAIRKYLGEIKVFVYDSPYQRADDAKELLYIIEIKN